jgi:hypothetical protein
MKQVIGLRLVDHDLRHRKLGLQSIIIVVRERLKRGVMPKPRDVAPMPILSEIVTSEEDRHCRVEETFPRASYPQTPAPRLK